MGGVFIELVPLIVGAAVLPVWIIMTLFLLRSDGGAMKATAFVAGAAAVRLVQGVIFGFVLGTADQGGDESGAIVAVLLLVAGIAMLITAVKKWRKEEDPDAPSPKWMAMLQSLSALKAFAMGALLMALALKQWVFTLSAIAIIEQAGAGLAPSVLAFLAFVLGAQLLVATPIAAYAIAPSATGRLLDAAQNWLERYERVILTAVSFIFGLWFLWKGLAGLHG
jgi:hypothetical protein